MRAWVVVACLTAASVAHADDKAKAKTLYEEGLRHFNVAEYTDAITAWKESYLLVHKPLVLFNIGQAYRLAGDCTHALTFYDNYTREEPSPRNQDDVDQAIAACKSALAAKPPEPEATKPEPEPEPVKPAPEPEPAKPALSVVAQKPAPASASAVAVVPPPHRSRLRTIGMYVGGVGVASGAVGLLFAIRSKQDSDALNGFTGTWTSKQDTTQSEGQAAATRAWVLGIGGAALVAAGATMFVIGGREATHGVAVAPLPGGAAVAWGTSF